MINRDIEDTRAARKLGPDFDLYEVAAVSGGTHWFRANPRLDRPRFRGIALQRWRPCRNKSRSK